MLKRSVPPQHEAQVVGSTPVKGTARKAQKKKKKRKQRGVCAKGRSSGLATEGLSQTTWYSLFFSSGRSRPLSWPASECLLRASFSVLGTAGPFLLLLSMLCLIRAVQLLLSHLLRVVSCCAVMPRRLPCWPRGGRAGHHQQRTGSFSDSVEHSLFHGFRVFATCITTTDHADTCVLPPQRKKAPVQQKRGKDIEQEFAHNNSTQQYT